MMYRATVRGMGSVALAILASAGCGKDPAGPSAQSSAPLTLTRVIPDRGPGSGLRVAIVGTGFKPGAHITFGGEPAEVTATASTRIDAIVPAHAEGAVDVVVDNSDGQTVTAFGGFTYVPFAITSVSPAAGLYTDAVVITGSGFLPNAIVRFGDVRGTLAAFTATALQVIVPEHAPGAVDLTVTNPGGQCAVAEHGFVYESVSIAADASTVVARGLLSVTWAAPKGRSALDWIAFLRVNDPNSDGLGWWDYTRGATSGTLTLAAPANPGQYQFRYLVNDSYTDVARSPIVTVTAGALMPEFLLTRAWRAAGR